MHFPRQCPSDTVHGTLVWIWHHRFTRLDYLQIVDLKTRERAYRQTGRSVFVPPNRSLGWGRDLGRDGIKPPVQLATSRHIFLIRNGDPHATKLGCVTLHGCSGVLLACPPSWGA